MSVKAHARERGSDLCTLYTHVDWLQLAEEWFHCLISLFHDWNMSSCVHVLLTCAYRTCKRSGPRVLRNISAVVGQCH